jgi:hypothetical protein
MRQSQLVLRPGRRKAGVAAKDRAFACTPSGQTTSGRGRKFRILCRNNDFTQDAPAILVKVDALDGCCESFSGRLRDEPLSPEILCSFADTRPVAGGRMHDN